MSETAFDPRNNPRHLIIILGDQLDRDSAVFDAFDPEKDAVWMAEAHEELSHVWCHQLRIAYFLSCMRHFREELRERGIFVHYHEIQKTKKDDAGEGFIDILAKSLRGFTPKKLLMVRPGDWRVKTAFEEFAKKKGLPLQYLHDRHFFISVKEFEEFSRDRKGVVLETFYRWMRKKFDVLMTENGKPTGGAWNYDKENRETYKSAGPGKIKAPRSFQTDRITKEVLALVEKRYGDHPGSLENFDLPVTHSQALDYLRDFIEHRLHDFGTYQDAMWTGEPFLNHSRLSCVLNNKLLDARHAVERVAEAYEDGHAPINSVEGFVRQILGWREFVRGIYWKYMPDYQDMNALSAEEDLPHFYWDGDTDMECIRQSMKQVIDHGYAHHIQRLMVLGLFALNYGVHPRKFHEWHMAMYLDAIDWVSLPNALGMSQYGDGGIIGTKPYCASGNYINRMGNYCRHCRYSHGKATGENACPVTTFYWDFLARNQDHFQDNPRMNFQMKNLEKKDPEELKKIRSRAGELRKEWA